MSNLTEYFKNSELALAAYADLSQGTPDIDELYDDGKGMSPTQAARFASRWRVVDQYTDPRTGLSATVFEEVGTGERGLAIRGTQLEAGDLLADGLLALGVSDRLNPQWSALEAKLGDWLGEGGPL